MAVLNLHVLPGQKVPENAVYVGRANIKKGLKASPFANPFPLSNWLDTQERARVLVQYEKWLWQQIQAGAITQQQLVALNGKDLVCYCAPLDCHATVVARAVKWAVKEAAGPGLEAARPSSPHRP